MGAGLMVSLRRRMDLGKAVNENRSRTMVSAHVRHSVTARKGFTGILYGKGVKKTMLNKNPKTKGNPNTEARNPKEIRIPNTEMTTESWRAES